MQTNQPKEELLLNFLKDLNEIVFVKSTNSATDMEEDLNPQIKDYEAIIEIIGQFDREDLKEALGKIYQAGLLAGSEGEREKTKELLWVERVKLLPTKFLRNRGCNDNDQYNMEEVEEMMIDFMDEIAELLTKLKGGNDH